MPEDYVDKLSHQSIQQYLDQASIDYTTAGSYLRLVEHDSCIVDTRITENHTHETFNWNSRGVGGDLNNFLQVYVGMPREEAWNKLKELRPELAKMPNKKPCKEVKYQPEKWSASSDTQKVTDYLVNIRCLESKTVEMLLKEDYVRQLGDGNCLFVWRSSLGKEIGSDIQGTTIDHKKYGKRGTLKKIVSGSQAHSGFNFQNGPGNGNLCVFESPVDAISYSEMGAGWIDQSNASYLSLNGAATKLQTIDEFVKDHGVPKELHLCFDTDRAGKTAVLKYLKAHNTDTKGRVELNGHKVLLKIDRPNRQYKDWNESLQNGDKWAFSQSPRTFIRNINLQNHDELVSILNELSPHTNHLKHAGKNANRPVKPVVELAKRSR